MPLNEPGLKPHAGVTALTPSKPSKPDQRHVGSGCLPRASACLTDPSQPSPTASLELKATKENAHNGYVLSVGYSSEGDKIVSGGRDGTLKVWDAGASACPISPLAQT